MNKERQKLKILYKNLYVEVNKILFKHDIMDINFKDNIEEYEPEVDTILPRLSFANNIEDVSSIVYEEFVKWFDKDIIPHKESLIYTKIAEEIWVVWTRYSKKI